MVNDVPMSHYTTSEAEERAALVEIHDQMYAARKAKDDALLERLVAHLEEEKRRLDQKYHRPGTSWMENHRFDYPDGHSEILPAGRYTDAEWLDLSEAVQRQARDRTQIEKQEEALQALQTRVREFCLETQELHAKAADETGELKALLSRAQA